MKYFSYCITIYHMKKVSLVFPILMSLALSGCSISFEDFFSIPEELTIQDNHNGYVVGDIYRNTNELIIQAKYKDDVFKEFSYSSVRVIIEKEDKHYSEKESFSEAGEYSLYVIYGSVKSNLITFDVFDSVQYASSINLTCDKNDIKTMEEMLINVNVNPSEFTVPLVIESSSDTTIIKKIDKDCFYFYEEEEKAFTLTIKALKNATEYVESSMNFNVTKAAEEVEILQTYKDLDKKNCPSSGDVNLLVIPLWFNDSATYFKKNSAKENIRKDIETTYFGSESQTGWHSVSSFYKAESKEKLNLSGKVSEWYEPDISTADIGSDSSDRAPQTQTLVNNATNWYFSTHLEDSRSNYDSDGDGYLDGVMVIYAAPNWNSYGVSEEYSKNKNLWAYCFYIEKNSPNIESPTAKSFFWASYDFMYGELKANERTGSSFHKGNTSYCNLDSHTYIHEMGHVFGLQDYYDYSKHGYLPSGGFSMQDYNVGGHDPFSMMAFGWVDPIIPTNSCRIKLNSFQETGELILLTPNWNEYNSPFDEYLLLELYTPTGLNKFDTSHQYVVSKSAYPKGVNDIGIRLWHIDARLSYTIDNYFNFSEELTTNAKCGYKNLTTIFSNTYIDNSALEAHVSYLAKKNVNYSYFNLLSLVRNDKNATSIFERSQSNLFNSESLFKSDDSFDLQTFGKQFPRKEYFGGSDYTLDSGLDLGWSFIVESIENNSAIIRVEKI